MGLRDLERGLERSVEGVFGRLFRSGVRPVEIGRRITREADDMRSVGVSGETLVPNEYRVRLSPDDHATLESVQDSLCRELADALREHARGEHYAFMGPISVALAADESLKKGRFHVDSRMREGEGGTGAGSLVLPNGERIVLGEYVVTIGRLDECTITLGDRNASRHHAEIRPAGDGFRVVDLGSTNGTMVNGVHITDHVLSDGDVLAFGNTTIVFEAS